MQEEIGVSFATHIPEAQVASLISSIAAYGNVLDGRGPREFRIEVFRASKTPQLLKSLMEWERYGFLTYQLPPSLTARPS